MGFGGLYYSSDNIPIGIPGNQFDRIEAFSGIQLEIIFIEENILSGVKDNYTSSHYVFSY